MQLSHMRFIKTSLPFTFSTMAASLMGAVDTAVVGHLGNYTYINAVSLGAVIFSTVYWLFGFLKISTSGFAAQAMDTTTPSCLQALFCVVYWQPSALASCLSFYRSQSGVLRFGSSTLTQLPRLCWNAITVY